MFDEHKEQQLFKIIFADTFNVSLLNEGLHFYLEILTGFQL